MKFWSNFVLKKENSFYEVKPFVKGILIKLCFKPTDSNEEFSRTIYAIDDGEYATMLYAEEY